MKKILKRILLVIVAVLAILIVGLIINNRVFYLRYNNADTKKDYLSEEDIGRIHNIYNYLSEEGNNIFVGFDGKDMNLLLYNEAFEFLFSDNKPSGQEWIYIGKDKYLGKLIHRRIAVNSQAFAVKIDSTWTGSFATLDTYHKLMLREIPIFYPPQLVSADEQYYKAIVIHEMTHAYQGKCNSIRIDQAEHIQNINSTFDSNSRFNSLIVQEAKYLETAIQSDDINTVRTNTQNFLQTRVQRRKEFQMTVKDIVAEQEFEWLEGLARYAECKVSQGSSSPIAKGLSNISEKVKIKSDDRYYTLGMAEYIIIQKLDKKSEQKILQNNVALEDILSDLCRNVE
jgi:hypothetical protein